MNATVAGPDLVDEAYDAVSRLRGVAWVAGRADAEALVVLFRCLQRSESVAPVEGVRILTRETVGVGHSAVSEVVREITHPGGVGQRLDVVWAKGMLPQSSDVLWRGGAAVQAAQDVMHLFTSSAQGCSGIPL